MIQRINRILQSIAWSHHATRTGKKLVHHPFCGRYLPADNTFLLDSEKEKILEDAQRLLDGAYQIYNFPVYQKVDWHRDPVSGVTVKIAACAAMIKTSVLKDVADVKNYWEQGHLHPILTLSQAYAFTQNEAFAQKAVELVLDFIRKNPCGRTVAWKCHMDSAIRLANMAEAMGNIQQSPCFAAHQEKIRVSMAEHIIYIASDYEDKGKYPNNHYLSDLTGVLFGTVFLYKNYECKEALPYFENAMHLLSGEVVRQVHTDGFDYEHSTYYHCFVTELFSELQDMLSRNGMEVPSIFAQVTETMLGVCKRLNAFDSSLPLIGDQDGSRLFHRKGCLDIDRCDFSALARFCPQTEVGKTESAGIYILEEKDTKVFFKCGGVGTGGKGTHDHNDQLSVCIFMDGKAVVTDSGTMCYTGDTEQRTKFRSVKAHSTVYFGQKEQNDITNIFAMKTTLAGELLAKEKDTLTGVFVYEDGTKHTRTITLKDEAVSILDKASGGVSRLVIPAPMDAIKKVSDFEVWIQGISICSDAPLVYEEATISPAYGVEIPATYMDSPTSKCHLYTIKRA